MPNADNKMAIKLFRRIHEARARGVQLDAMYISKYDFEQLVQDTRRYSHAEVSGVLIKPITDIQ